MKKTLVSILIGLFMVGVSGQAWAGNVVAADLNCTNPAGCVETNEISDAAVTNGKIADGAVTDGKITGPISASKLEKPANEVVVAKSGGDYTSISAALAAVNPTANNPYLIKVMPGIYNESVVMKSYTHLQGVGKDSVTIDAIFSSPYGHEDQSAVLITDVTNVSISGLNITAQCQNYIQVRHPLVLVRNSSGVSISENIVSGINCDRSGLGIWMADGNSDGTITNNIVTNNQWIGIYSTNHDNPVIISNNTLIGNQFGIFSHDDGMVTGNTITGGTIGHSGLVCQGSANISSNVIIGHSFVGIATAGSSSIMGNTVTGNGYFGMIISSGSPVVTNNVITNNQSDISIGGTASPTINFNTINTLLDRSSGNGKGNYNVTTEGIDLVIP